MSTRSKSEEKATKSKGSPHTQSLKQHNEQKRNSQEVLGNLQDALRRGVAVESTLWSFTSTDWITTIQAADIDNDGDIEILVSSRDGYLRALTRRGAIKWEQQLKGEYISALCAIPFSEKTAFYQARIIVGTRRGKVYAYSKQGERLGGWEYDTGRIIRQIYISKQTPENVILGSEDRCIHVLNSETGELGWKYSTDGWIRCVSAYDIDGDGYEEILGGSGDKFVHILNHHGHQIGKVYVGHQVYALFVALLEDRESVHLITSSNRKDLSAWKITRQDNQQWSYKKEWEKSPRDHLFENRIHSIYVEDINNDRTPEILVGSEDGHLYVLDHYGNLLWKHNFHSCIYSVHAADINFDSQIEILVGTEGNIAYTLSIDLVDNLYERIKNTYRAARRVYKRTDIMNSLLVKEKILLTDFIKGTPLPHRTQMELGDALHLMDQGLYEKAISILLRLLQEKVQYYWSHPVKTKGYIWSQCFANVNGDTKQEIIVGTDKGYLYAFDAERDENRQIWAKNLGDRVRTVQTSPSETGGYDSIIAVLANHRVVLLDYKGELIKEHTFEDKQDWARSVSVHEGNGSSPSSESEIVIGLENHKISIWDAELRQQITEIPTPQGIGVVYTYDLSGDGSGEIISGSINNQVYVHNRQGKELWHFETQDRVQALRVEDVDKDGHPEIIVGSEDRCVYVLDYEGHLKWRYRTIRGVTDVDICDLKLENDPDDEKDRTWKILVSSNDGYLYLLNAYGDLVWKYKNRNRVRAVHATDVNRDGRYEIAVASEDQLELLQILDRREIIQHIQTCWEALLDPEDHWRSIIKLTEHSDEYLHAYALAKLAGQHARREQDFKRFQEVLRDDDLLQVKKELVRSIVILCRVPSHHDENVRQARQILQKLSNDPDEEIRLAIIDILPLLANTEERLCFEYLEYFIHSADIWLRHAVVRQLNKLVKDYPKPVFQMLLRTAKDEEEWLRQETGRVLASYFDTHVQLLIPDALTLINDGVDEIVLQQIVYSSSTPAIKGMFRTLIRQMKEISTENLPEILDETIATLDNLNTLGVFYGEEILQVYEEFRQILHTKSIDAIASYQRITRADAIEIPSYNTSQIIQVFNALQQIVEIVKIYQRRETTGDLITSLITAMDTLDKARSTLHENLRLVQPHKAAYRLPESSILAYLLEHWSKVIKSEILRLRGEARLVAEIRNKVVRPEEDIVISLLIRNEGRSPADNVRVILEEGNDFEIVGDNQRTLIEVSSNRSSAVDFTIKVHVTRLRLYFRVVYDDAERKAKEEKFADEIVVQGYQRPYQWISNPYTSGTPIRDSAMFYGRHEDIESLREKLSSISANKVVVLSGQRRMGKTSLIYQLANELAQGAYAPVLIDMQALSLVSTAAQLLKEFAVRICDELEKYKGISLPAPGFDSFQSNPTTTFNDYLTCVLKMLRGSKLVILLDEFEKLQEQIDQKILHPDVLNYLRSLMQHRQGLNFLLAGSPRIRYITESYWSVFFNIALHHSLSKLKPEEAEALIIQPIEKCVEYDALALDKMHQLTGDQPYLIHVISERLIAYCNKHRKSYITVKDVNTVCDIVLDEQTSSIRWIWDQSSRTERFVLSILAQEKGETERIFSLNDIRIAYDAQGVPFVRQEVMNALQNLKREDIVEERFNGIQFRIPIGLLKEWLRKAKPPERAAREELLNDN